MNTQSGESEGDRDKKQWRVFPFPPHQLTPRSISVFSFSPPAQSRAATLLGRMGFSFMRKAGPEGDRTVHANNPDQNAQFADNAVTNTKYTLINFVPKNLAEQFR